MNKALLIAGLAIGGYFLFKKTAEPQEVDPQDNFPSPKPGIPTSGNPAPTVPGSLPGTTQPFTPNAPMAPIGSIAASDIVSGMILLSPEGKFRVIKNQELYQASTDMLNAYKTKNPQFSTVYSVAAAVLAQFPLVGFVNRKGTLVKAVNS